MNIKLITDALRVLLVICFVTGMILLIYTTVVEDVSDLVHSADYVSFDPKAIPLFLILPTAVVADFVLICGLFPIGTPPMNLAKFIIIKFSVPLVAYGICAMLLGSVLSFIILIHPLGTDYYKCDSTSIISSGAVYAKTEALCKQRALDIKKRIGADSEDTPLREPQQ